MNFIGDYFALGLVAVLGMFFFDARQKLTGTSRYYLMFLGFTALNAIVDLATGQLMDMSGVPLWANMGANTLYFLTNILATSSAALYLFTRILEHSHDKHCMKNAMVGLGVCLGVYLAILAANYWTGWVFYFGEDNVYRRGPLNVVGYFVTICQMVLVLICYFRNRKNAGSSMKRVLIQIFPVAVMCIIVQRRYPEIMLNSFMMSMAATVLFLTYQSQRQGVHVLTRLNDRHRFFEHAASRIERRSPFQVFLINLKNYGAINQKFGHVFGDEALYQFAFALEKLIHGSEAFHMNGTVFALAVPYLNQHDAERNVRALLEFMENGVPCAGEHLNLDYVVVEYVAFEEEKDPGEFYEKLEYAAAQAYRRREKFIRYTPSMGVEMQRRRYLIDRMRTIDREHGFEVWYQPIRCLKSGRFCSMEALIRMYEPDGTVIGPGEFVPLAEQTNMIAPITWFVLEEVCRFLREHPELDGVSVGVNLPMAQLLDNSVIVRINGILGQYGIDHSRIGLEFTERAILENFEQTSRVMWRFRNEGYRFYLDDFGEGYSNFNCLLQLPFQIIKLDKKLVRMELTANGDKCLGLTQRLISFLHERNLQVIAEGVENEEDAEKLRSQGVDRIQGYVYARPMPGEELLAFYREHGGLNGEEA